MSKKKVLGRTFEEPSCRYDDLIDESVFENPPGLLSLTASFIPFFGAGAVIGSLVASYTISNRYGNAENAWRATAYGAIIQAVSFTMTYMVFVL